MSTILLFGTFDGVHEGHRNLFEQARKHADHVVVAVAPDRIVTELKGRPPRREAQERIKGVQSVDDVDEVVLGDQKLSSYKIIQAISPDKIGIGYDQNEFAEDVRTWIHTNLPDVEIIRLESHLPDTFKSSLLE